MIVYESTFKTLKKFLYWELTEIKSSLLRNSSLARKRSKQLSYTRIEEDYNENTSVRQARRDTGFLILVVICKIRGKNGETRRTTSLIRPKCGNQAFRYPELGWSSQKCLTDGQ